MLNYLFHFLTGYVIIKIEGHGIENFLNACAKENIKIHGLKRHGREYATGEIYPSVYHRAKLYARDNKCKISVVHRGGMPFALRRMKKRKTLCIGFIVALFLLMWLCSRIWVIDILETDPERCGKIAMVLQENNIVTGMPRHSLKPFELQQEVLATHDEYSWFWVELKGTHVSVDVRYRTPPPEIVDEDKTCNLIASKSGLITHMIVRMGQPAVKEGSAVKEGQLLVSGVVPNSVVGALYVHSDADIIAKTTHTASLSENITIIRRIKTGNITKKYSMVLFGKNFNLFLKAPGYKHYNGIVHEKRLKLFGDYFMPVSLRTCEYSEIVPTPTVRDKTTVEESLKTRLREDLEISVGAKNILSFNFETQASPDGTVTVTMRAECLENIVNPVEITFSGKQTENPSTSEENEE
ncbi:MAG: sporulation protein YqfD [Bacillota bacterium]|nr:sporulation protein YqfD [Bacillota bacterium]